MRIAVTGGRDYRDEEYVNDVLDALHKEDPIVSLAHGGAKGADALAAKWGHKNKVLVIPFVAEWLLYGGRAGPMRNRLMLEKSEPDVLVAFPGGRGTADCVRQARKMGIRVHHALDLEGA